jgi:SulP family sulfate permease
MSFASAGAIAAYARPAERPYGWPSLRKDVVAGVTVAAISLPQAMAYALIAGVEPKYGLYSAIVVTAIASVFGSSAHLINGPTNAISLVVFSSLAFLDPEARHDAYEAMCLLAIMAGAIQIVISVLRLGDLTRYISESVVLGFMAGAGLLIALGQVGNVLGLAQRGNGHQALVYRFWLTVSSGAPVNLRSIAVAGAAIALALVSRRLVERYKLPRLDMFAALLVVSMLAAAAGWLRQDAGRAALVDVLGSVPVGLPQFHVPSTRLAWLGEMSGSAVAVAILGLLEALAIAKSIAGQTGQALDYNRQCLAEGLANLGGGFFQCLPGSGSLTRSAINFQAGAVTRLSGIFAAATVSLVMLSLAPLARFVPRAALAGLLVITAYRLIEWRRLARAVRASRYDAALVLTTGLAAVFGSVELAILIGVAASLVLFVPRAAHLVPRELVVGPDRVVRRARPGDPRCRLVAIYDIEGELFFGAAPELDRLLSAVAARLNGARVVVLRLRRSRNPDFVCLERLERFCRDMAAAEIAVVLTGVRPELEHAMASLDFRAVPQDRIFASYETSPGSSTIAAVRHAYRIASEGRAGACPHCTSVEVSGTELYYLV